MSNNNSSNLSPDEIKLEEDKPTFGKKEKINLAIMESSTASIEVISQKLPIYYTDFIGMSPSLIGTAHLLFAIVNAINDPILGYFIDKTKNKNGISKYTRILRMVIPLTIIAIVAMLIGQPGWPGWILFIVLFLGFSLRDTAYALQGISAASIIIQNEKQDAGRGQYVGIRLTLKSIFGVAGFLIPAYFLVGDKDSTLAPLLMFLGFGLVGLIVYIIPALRVNPPIHESIRTENESIGIEKKSNMFQMFKRMIKMKSYLSYIILAFFLTGVAMNQELFMLYFADDIIELSGFMSVLVSGLVLPLIIGTSLGSKYLINKFGIRKLLITSAVTIIVTNFIVLLQISDVISVVCLLLSITAGNFWFLIKFPITGTIIEEYAAIYGERNEGTFFGIDSIFNAPAVSVFLAIFLNIIEKIGYEGTLEFQTPQVKQGLLMTMTLISIIACSIALFIIIFFFPLGKKEK